MLDSEAESANMTAPEPEPEPGGLFKAWVRYVNGTDYDPDIAMVDVGIGPPAAQCDPGLCQN